MDDRSPTPAEAAIVALLDIAHAAEAAAVALKETTVTEPSYADNTAAADNTGAAPPADAWPDAAVSPPDAPGVSADAAGGEAPPDAAPTAADAIALLNQAIAILAQL